MNILTTQKPDSLCGWRTHQLTPPQKTKTQNYAAAVPTDRKPFNNVISMSHRKQINEGKHKETVQHESVQDQLYAYRSK